MKPSDLCVIEFSYHQWGIKFTKYAIFNQNVINEEEVRHLIAVDRYEDDERLIIASRKQIQNVLPNVLS